MDGWVVDIINIETPQRKDYQSAKTGPGVYLNFYSNNDLIQKLGASGAEGPLGARKDPKADANIPLVESIPITIPGQPLPANKIVTWFKDSGGHSLQNNELSNSNIVDQTKKAFDASLEKPANLKNPTNDK